jgi:hypothetical protein
VDAVEKWVPKNPRSWSKVYDKHQKEAMAEQERAAEALRAQFQGLNSSKDSGRTRLVAANALPPIRKSKSWGSSGWGQSTNSWNHQAGSKTKNIVQKARREAKEMSRFRGNGSRLAMQQHVGTASSAAARLSEGMKRKIKTAEDVRAEKDHIAEQSRRNGRASGALGKRKVEEREEEEEEEEEEHDEDGEDEKRRKTEEWRRKAMEKRAPAVGGPRLKQAPEKKAADPFFRSKKANPLAMPRRK